MKLIIAIIQDEYISKVIKVLMENKIRTTKLSSTGGFLKSGNTTLFIGVENDEIEMLQDILVVAINDAMKKIDKETEEKLGKYTQGMPGLF